MQKLPRGNRTTATDKVGENIPFQRIRRITGYLTTTLDKWNTAKQAEEKDRLKHTIKENEHEQR